MAYRYGNREQITFLPDSIENYVTEQDPVRVYDAFIDTFDLGQLGMKLDDNAVGNSSYDPITMLKILIYGYSYGWRSSRKLERALYHNMSFIWLAGGLKPDHKTISKFRKDHKSLIKGVLSQCARLCMKLGLIEGNSLFVDGSKFRANAGNGQTKSIDTWKRYKKHIENRIEELLEDCQKIDDRETESLVTVNKELQSKEKLRKKISHLLEEMEESSSDGPEQDKINGTDPDCKIMKGRHGSHAGYNGQIVADDKHGLIVSTDVTSSKNDLNELSKQVKNAEQILEKSCENVCADAGYSSLDDIVPLMEGRTVVVPNNKQVQKKQKENSFAKEAFTYNPTEDTYTCPEGKGLYRANVDTDRGRIEYRMEVPSDCRSCIHFGVCTKSKSGRRIYRRIHEQSKELLEKMYDSDEGQLLYAKRKMRVEHPFGHMKNNLGARSFLIRGIEGVKAELSLLGTCFNITRLITISGGTQALIRMLRE